MALLYFKNPSDGAWVPFGTSDPVADEVVIASSPGPTDTSVDLWIDPTGTGSSTNWPLFDQRYVSQTDPANAKLSVPLTLVGAPTADQHAATKQYVDSSVTALANATQKARMPVGSVTLFIGTYVPPGWYRCDGSQHNSWALQRVLNSPITPRLKGPTQGLGYIIYGGS